jgi:acyl carrier protein
MSDTTERIMSFVIQNFYVPDVSTLADEVSLIEAGIVDSTGVLEITAFLESEYGIDIEDHEIVPDNLDSIPAIVDFVTRKQAASSAA